MRNLCYVDDLSRNSAVTILFGSQEHLQCYEDAAIATNQSTREAVEAARSLVNSSKALQNEMKQLEPLASHVRALRAMLEQLEAQADLIL